MKKTALNLIDFIKRDKKRGLIAAAAVCAILLAVLFSIPTAEEKTEESSALAEYKARLEEELGEMCSSISGVGRCRVTVSFSEGESLEYKGSSLIGSKPPQVLGVCIVCEGAERDGVRSALCDCMRSLFDIGANRVSVMKMK